MTTVNNIYKHCTPQYIEQSIDPKSIGEWAKKRLTYLTKHEPSYVKQLYLSNSLIEELSKYQNHVNEIYERLSNSLLNLYCENNLIPEKDSDEYEEQLLRCQNEIKHWIEEEIIEKPGIALWNSWS